MYDVAGCRMLHLIALFYPFSESDHTSCISHPHALDVYSIDIPMVRVDVLEQLPYSLYLLPHSLCNWLRPYTSSCAWARGSSKLACMQDIEGIPLGTTNSIYHLSSGLKNGLYFPSISAVLVVHAFQ